MATLGGCAQANRGANTAATPNGATSSSVIRVVDGDTILARVAGKSEYVRLIGIDTPETVDPHRPVGCYGKQASDFAKSLMPPKTPVRLVLDAETRDKYKRLLAYVYLAKDNLFVNAELAQQGYANLLTFPPNVAHEAQFVSLVHDAYNHKRGLWGACPDTQMKR